MLTKCLLFFMFINAGDCNEQVLASQGWLIRHSQQSDIEKAKQLYVLVSKGMHEQSLRRIFGTNEQVCILSHGFAANCWRIYPRYSIEITVDMRGRVIRKAFLPLQSSGPSPANPAR
jgi:hypothetical protein